MLRYFATIALTVLAACGTKSARSANVASTSPEGITRYDSAGSLWLRLAGTRWLVHEAITGTPSRQILIQEATTTRCCVHAERETESRIHLTGWRDSLTHLT